MDYSIHQPYHVAIPTICPSAANTAWSTVSVNTTDFGNARLATNNSSQNNSIEWDVVLGPGTWTLYMGHRQGTNLGIYTITVDGASLTSLSGAADTIDGYAAAGASSVSTVTGIVIAAPGGVKRVKLTMATKNASSSAYNGILEGWLGFYRTA